MSANPAIEQMTYHLRSIGTVAAAQAATTLERLDRTSEGLARQLRESIEINSKLRSQLGRAVTITELVVQEAGSGERAIAFLESMKDRGK
jgi:hypothetical protein